MAAKHRRTKDWDESNNDNSSDDDDNSLSRLKKVSSMKREKDRKRIKLNLVSSDSSGNDVQFKGLKNNRPKSSLQATKKTVTSNSDDSDSDLSNFNRKKHKILKSKSNYQKKRELVAVNSSETDSKTIQSLSSQRCKSISEERESNINTKNNKIINDINKINKINQYLSDIKTSKLKKSKTKKFKKLRSTDFDEDMMDNYSIISTPCRSDDENIHVQKKQEISLKHYIIEEIDKIQNMAEELKTDLKYQGDYLIDKKVDVVRDSKFIAHKILRIYDSVFEKLKANRNNFANIYNSWLDACSNNKSKKNQRITNENVPSCNESEDTRNKQKKDSEYPQSTSANVSSKSSKREVKLNYIDDSKKHENIRDKFNINEKNTCDQIKKNLNLSLKKNELDTSSNSEISNKFLSKNNDTENLSEMNESYSNINNNLISKVDNVSNSSNKSDSGSSSSLSIVKPKKKISEKISSLEYPFKMNSTLEVSECDSDEIFSVSNKCMKDHKKNTVLEKNKGKEEMEEEEKEEEEEGKEEEEEVKTENDNYKHKILFSSDNEDSFESSTSEIGNTPVKPPILSSKMLFRKTSLTSSHENIGAPIKNNSCERERKSTSPSESNIEDSERMALKSLLQDFDSNDSSSEERTYHSNLHKSEKNIHSVILTKESEDEGESSIRKSNKLLKKNKQLLMQTKKQNSISSDSSSDSAGGRNGQKISRQANGDDLPPRYRRRQAFNVQKNRHYKADKKLRMECRVTLERLSQNALENYSSALEKSKKYVANKKFHSITNLDGLELKKKKFSASDESLSSDNNPIISKIKKKNNSEKNPLHESLDEDNDFDDSEKNKILSDVSFEEEIITNDENKAKEALLETCTDSSNGDNSMDLENTMEVDQNDLQKSENLKVKIVKNDDAVFEDSENNEDMNEKKDNWKEDKLLNFQLTDTESDGEKLNECEENKEPENVEEENNKSIEEGIQTEKTPVKKKRKQRKMRVLDSDSDAKNYSSDEESNDSELECEEENEEEDKKKSRKREKSSESDTSSDDKKRKSKRRRIKKVATDSESDDQDSPGKGRKNIRKVLKDKHVADDTKKAAQDEEERLKRIAERQRLFNEMYDARLAGEAKVDKLVLDFDEETKKELVVVDKELVKRLKPHQAKGIKFMWDACFESLKQIEKSEGSGCIIAHCMGLGKTFQVVTLSHTLLSHEETKVRTVMVVCPLSTVLNWVNEFKMWLKHVKNGDDIEIYELTKMKKNIERKYQLESWKKTGGVLIIGYEMFRNLTSTGKKMRKAMQESIMRSLVDPGADLVVCDEGHLLKNEESALSKAMKLVKTLRRIVLTGTPLQNNLKEYHCMVQFVKPNLLGSKKEFLNRFVNPITNGQFDDSTPYDVKLMKKRAHVLHKMLEGSVQRFDYSVLTPFLPPKQEYVIFVRLTEVQIKMYQHYLDNFARRFGQRNGSLFADFQELQRIWTHPYVLRLNAEKVEKANEKKRFEASDSEGSLKDFIDDESDSDSSPSSSSASGSNSDIQSIHSDTEKPTKMTRSARMNAKAEDLEEVVPIHETVEESAWWSKFVEKEHFEDLRISTKLVLLFGILKESEQIGDKVLVFSQSLYSLTLIEQFLNLIDQETQNNVETEHLDKHSGSWALGLDYFRLDGSTSAENRSAWCKIFNNPNNTRARLFLISTRAGGLGINLTAANRVIIFDASWNPSHDVQSIFRIYRFGQKKPCYVYRFLAAGTMEEKIYNRQVTKLSLACRVVDEQQIERHYSNNDLAELYQFESYEGKSATLNLPKDRLLAEIFLKYKDAVYNYHEHDSLLENKQEEELDEEERKQAWLEYEEEKQGKRQMINMGNNMGFNQMLMNMNSFPELENIKLLIQKDYPNLPPEHLESVARQAVYDMYRFVDQQAVNQTLNPFGAVQPMQPSNMFGPAMPQVNQQQPYNPQSQLMNMLNQPQMNYPGVNHMPVYSGRGRPPKHMSMNNPMPNIRPMQAPAPIRLQQPQLQPMSNNDEVEILTEQQVTPNIDSVSNTKNIQNE